MFWLHFLGSSRVVHLYTQIMAQSHGDISDLNPERQMNKVKIMLIAAGDICKLSPAKTSLARRLYREIL